MAKTKAKSPTWVFVAGIYRSASTTQYQITRDIVETTKSGKGIGHHTEGRLEDNDTDGKNRYIVCKVFKYLPLHSDHGKKFLDEGRLKTMVTMRDPRDIIVSMRTRQDRRGPDHKFDFKEAVTLNLPIWLSQLQQWIDLGPEITMTTKFETFISNIYGEVCRIASHLQIDLPKANAHEIAGRYSIRAMTERKRQARVDGKKEDAFLPSIPAVVFGTSGIHKSWLSPVERSRIEEHGREFMEKWGYL